MQGVLYVSHGSRVPEATQEAIEFITDVQQQVDISLQTICFLELAEPTIAEGVETAAYYNASSPVQVTYSPVNNFYGTSQEDMEAVLETDQERFALMMEEYMKNNRRFSFGGK